MIKTKRSRTWIIRGIGGSIGVTVALAVILGVAATGVVSPPPARAANDIYLKYDGVGTQTTTPSTCIDCLVTTFAASGTLACSNCAGGDPATGNFALGLDFTPYPPSPCKPLSVSGTLTVEWDIGQVSRASVFGRFVDGHPTLLLSGKYPTGPIFSGDPFQLVLNHFPPSPCLASTDAITGVLSISTR